MLIIKTANADDVKWQTGNKSIQAIMQFMQLPKKYMTLLSWNNQDSSGGWQKTDV